MNSFFNELKRRNVIKAAIAYIVVGWVLLQVASIVLPIINAPEWVIKTFSFFLLLGFPIWLIISWVYEVTPEGLKKTEIASNDQSVTATTNKRLNILILVGLFAAILVALLRPTSGLNYSTNSNKYAIAVLPFDDMSPEKDTEWFCDGVTEDILAHLSKINGLKVISRTSTERYKNTDKSVPEIAEELGVSYVVEGSVRKHNNDVLITAQLITAKDEHLWADKFNEQLIDVFKIQGEVSRKIVQQLKIKISPEEEKVLNDFPTDNMEAYQAYLQGRSLVEQMNPKDAEIAISFFEKAIALDPNYADAYAELAFAQMTTILDTAQAEKNINKALDLNPNSSRANSYKGMYLDYMQEKPDEAIAYLERAIELNPNDAKAHDMMAAYYGNINNKSTSSFEPDYDKALYHVNIAVDLDPFSTQSQYLKTFMLLENKMLDEAEALFKEKMDIYKAENRQTIAWQLMNGRIRENFAKGKPQEEEIKILRKAASDYPFNAKHINRRIATAYDGIYNDNTRYLEYARKAFEMDSSRSNNVSEYHTALVENNKFDEALMLRNSENYKKVISATTQKGNEYYYYYLKSEYDKALDVLNDSLMHNRDLNAYDRQSFVYAQMGNKTKAYEKLNSGKMNNRANKALLFAILEERDSLYENLSKLTPSQAKFPNSRAELDPYRKEAKYIKFLKKNRFPIDQQKN